MAILTFVRHGQSVYNFENRFTGTLDIALTPLGQQEAKLAGMKLIGYEFNIAYTSMLVRAQESLEIILKEIHLEIPIVKNGALNERMYGNLQGLNKAETAQRYGAAQVEIWRRSYDIRPPGGESLQDTYNRVIRYYKSVIAPELQSGHNVLVVAHGNSLRALMMYLENITPKDIVNVNIPTGLPRVYQFDGDLQISFVKYL
ncbi:2,3-bisphosphoglycerate-dependent phosphoglycerate mutase [Flavobacterium noncentrifugens]|uniref:2,3-bisphosphoglycerate-dependent phosphoglycerate mutase n=1 Tax=Flavobacterium noncentrifugens TaxID=1128970 RepID=A0A1G8WWI7_9FLAO|nr:2,3-bisphosphoglycerate-dependent phosphoglycerate mutase [Flavobacterium noncentrifugens]GEP51077.1 2,3-bisphosphoglycerate-dependent phosphoglycerate mutase [Flavobacterium noncentrifugens]SDJ82594.1 2,3-bisphosphoglycerate-dependent phosphoglycerate mutase [Flavobacterium noncentrifugens]